MEVLLIFFVILCIFVIIEWMREIHTFRVTHYHITSKKLHGLNKSRKIVLLSDLHNCSYGKNNEKLLTAIKKENPDLILIAGDMVVGKPEEPTDVAEKFVMRLPEVCDVYYANGNHEHRMKENTGLFYDTYEKYKTKLEDAGVIFLENERISFLWDNVPVEICGLEIPREKYVKFRKETYELSLMTEQIGEADNTKYEMLIAHNPIFMQTYMDWGADLVVSGHLHGGVIRLPFIGGIITPQFSLFPKYSGEMTKVKDASVVVSKGIGVHTIKIRLFNPAEIVVLHIDGTEEQEWEYQ